MDHNVDNKTGNVNTMRQDAKVVPSERKILELTLSERIQKSISVITAGRVIYIMLMQILTIRAIHDRNSRLPPGDADC